MTDTKPKEEKETPSPTIAALGIAGAAASETDGAASFKESTRAITLEQRAVEYAEDMDGEYWEDILEYIGAHDYPKASEMFRRVVKNTYYAGAQDKTWVSVRDQTPPEGLDVLTIDREGMWDVCAYFWDRGWNNSAGLDCIITHWCFIPQPIPQIEETQDDIR